MKAKKNLLKKSRLYIILDKNISHRDIPDTIARIKGSGVDIIQLRDKESKKEAILKDAFLLRRTLLNAKTLFIINDYLDVAKIVDSDGLHLGQQDSSLKIARKILGQDKIIGVSCHNLKQALQAQKEGADYLGVGPIFPTSTKPQTTKPIGLSLIKELKKKIKIPFFVIGGINQDNINKVLSSGIGRVAMCSAIFRTKDISSRIRYFSKILN
jgi:thiamine-phosphate pyrophosphorylase